MREDEYMPVGTPRKFGENDAFPATARSDDEKSSPVSLDGSKLVIPQLHLITSPMKNDETSFAATSF